MEASSETLRTENEYLREAIEQAVMMLKLQPVGWTDLIDIHIHARKTLEFGLAHAGDGK